MSFPLYPVVGEYARLMEKLNELDMDEQTIADTIEGSGLTDELAEMGQSLEMIARTAVESVPAIDAEIVRLTDLKLAKKRVAKGARDYLKRCMEASWAKRIDCPLFTIKLHSNPPQVFVSDPSLLPAKYFFTPTPPVLLPQPDKKALATAMKDGEVIPGARMTHSNRLSIS